MRLSAKETFAGPLGLFELQAMNLSSSPFTVLSYVGGPALLTNATALLLLSTSNRFARAVDRSRYLVDYLEGAGGPRPKAGAAQELVLTQDRVRIIGRALSLFYLATSVFALATMCSIAGAVAGEYISGLSFEAVIAFAVLSGIVGFTALVWGSLALVLECRLAMRSTEMEAKEAMAAIKRVLQDKL
jgi:hypothetical protein